jgi:hypothetical protein
MPSIICEHEQSIQAQAKAWMPSDPNASRNEVGQYILLIISNHYIGWQALSC